MRGERSEELSGRAAALGWAAMGPVVVLVGAHRRTAWTTRTPPSAGPPGRMRSEVLVGVHADQLVVVLGGREDLDAVADAGRPRSSARARW